MKNLLNNLGALSIGLIISILLIEVFLYFNNPFGFRQKGNQIILRSNRKYIFDNQNIKGVDSVIIHNKNSLGFRGEEIPDNYNNSTSIIAVGGSTTECLYLSDGKDWVSLLDKKLERDFDNIWLNNAGLDGHSTFGHQILLDDYLVKLKPDYIIFLVGVNDVGRGDIGKYDKRQLKTEDIKWTKQIENNSQLFSLIKNLIRNIRARRKNLSHYSVPSFEELEQLDSIQPSEVEKAIQSHQSFALNYESRLMQLIQTTKENNITPILATQPSLVGEGIDVLTGIDLEKVKLCHHLGGKVHWEILEVYNDITRKIATKEDIFIIDLAHHMPKSTDLFYDCIHFNNKGAEEVSKIFYEALKPLLYSKQQ